MQDKSIQNQLPKPAKRSNRNRKRSKKRSIFCKVHSCYLESESPKYRLSLLEAESEQDKERLNEFLLSLSEEQNSKDIQTSWIEAFWCPQCKEKRWYHVTKTAQRSYDSVVLSDRFRIRPEKGTSF